MGRIGGPKSIKIQKWMKLKQTESNLPTTLYIYLFVVCTTTKNPQKSIAFLSIFPSLQQK